MSPKSIEKVRKAGRKAVLLRLEERQRRHALRGRAHRIAAPASPAAVAGGPATRYQSADALAPGRSKICRLGSRSCFLTDRHGLFDTITRTSRPSIATATSFSPSASALTLLFFCSGRRWRGCWPCCTAWSPTSSAIRDASRRCATASSFAPADGKISLIERLRPPAELGLGDERARAHLDLPFRLRRAHQPRARCRTDHAVALRARASFSTPRSTRPARRTSGARSSSTRPAARRSPSCRSPASLPGAS